MEQIVISPAGVPLSASTAFLVPDTRAAIEMAVESFLSRLDDMDGDPDLEDNDDREASDGDSGDQAWIEWHTMRGSQKGKANLMAGEEDDEDGDPLEDDDPAGQSDEDGVNTGGVPHFGWGGPQGAGCPISDDDSEHDGRENDDGF